MKTGFALGTALLFASALTAQNRSGFVGTPGVTRGNSNAVLPAGTSAMPGIQRTTGNVLYPAGGGLQIGIPSVPYITPNIGHFTPFPPVRQQQAHRPAAGYGGYGYAVYVPNYYDAQYSYSQPVAPQPVMVVYPPQPAPVIINQYGPGDGQATAPSSRIFELPGRQRQVEQTAENEPVYYMLAFKDHSIYSAVAYWVDGDTLHYFTAGNVHNQASVALVDRELTERLNKDSGMEVKLPAAK